MTIREFRCECCEWVKEHWWNGAGAAVVLFLIVVFIWKRPDNDYLLYAALIMVGVHAYVSTLSFKGSREDRKHVEELAVAYREELKLQETHSHGPDIFATDRPTSERKGSSPDRVSRSHVRLVASTGR